MHDLKFVTGQDSRGKLDGRRMERVLRGTAKTVLLAGMIGVATAQDAIPDAQVEANVLKALASAPELASQSITTRTVYGVVTLSGNVQDDAARTRAENLAANANGVKKVVDEIQLGNAVGAGGQSAAPANSAGAQAAGAQAPGTVLLSDGTYGPDPSASGASPAPGSAPAAQAQRNDPENDQALDEQRAQQQGGGAQGGTNPLPSAGNNGGYPAQPNYPPANQSGNASQPNSYPPPNLYPQQGSPQQGYPQQQRGYAQNPYPQQQAPWGGQTGGQAIIIPVGAMVRVRVNQLIASNKAKPGDFFDGTIANDVVADGFVALPRGAGVQGRIVDAHPSGAVKGRGELSIQLTSVTLGGKIYPLASDVWAHDGADKTIQTINSAAGFGVAGALIGALAGRGAGAAIGAGVGAAAGVGASAASGRGQVIIPPEGMVTFHLAQPAPVLTVSEQEIQRLAYGAPSGGQPRRAMYARPGYPAYPPPYGYPPPY